MDEQASQAQAVSGLRWVQLDLDRIQGIKPHQTWAGVSVEGDIYLTADLAGGATVATHNAKHAGVVAACHEGHVYLPTAWIMDRYPETQAVCVTAMALVKEYLNYEQGTVV